MANKIISLNCQKKFYYFFFFWILELIIIICDKYIPNDYMKITMTFNNNTNNNTEPQVDLENLKVNQLISIICKIISKLLAGFGVFCNNEIAVDNINENKSKFYTLILISILLFLFKFVDFIYHLITKYVDYLNDNEMDWVVGIYIISTIIFCKYINKEIIFYKHHKVSIIITLISFSFMTFVDVLSIIIGDNEINYSYKLFYIVIYFLRSIFYPLINSISKILMNAFLTPSKLIFWEGVFETILLFLLLPILYFTQTLILGNFENKALLIWIFFKIGYIIVYYLRNLLVLEIINYFNPTYVFCMISINSFISFVANLSNDSKHSESIFFIILDFISLIILSFSTLLYNEILIIHKFGLDKKIKNQLEDVAQEEMISSFYYED